MNPELIEEENNFPRFRVIVAENETEDDILKRIEEKGDKIISSLQKIRSNVKEKRENKRNQGKVYTTQNRRKMAKKKRNISFPSDSEPEEGRTRKGEEGMEDNPPPLTESEWMESDNEDSEIFMNEESDSCNEEPENARIE